MTSSEEKTRTKQAEHAIDTVARTDLLAIINDSADGIMVIDFNGWVKFANPAAEQIFKSNPDNLVGSMLGIPATQTDPIEIELISKEGEFRPIQLWARPSLWEGEPAFRVSVRDLTEQRVTIQALRENEAEFRKLGKIFEQGLVYINTDGNIISTNEAAEDIFGTSRSELLGRSFDDYILAGKTQDGSELSQNENPVRSVLETGTSLHNLLLKIYSHHPKGPRWVLVNAIPVFRPNDHKAYHAYLTFDDITELILTREALQTTMENLRRSNADLQQFAYVVSHDLQAPLRSVTGFAQLLKRRFQGQLDQNADKYIEFIVDGLSHMKLMIESMLEFSRVETGAKPYQPVDCNTIITNILNVQRFSIEENSISISVTEMPTVMADENQLERVFQNLINNAIKFCDKDNPKVEISVKPQDEYWEFCVKDNGIGIDPKFHERIFQIFQRLHTSDEYEGVGIGLSVVKRIVERHGGTVRVDSTPGEGASFFFTIPKME